MWTQVCRIFRDRTPEPDLRGPEARLRGESGVTLIEVLLAAVILATVVIGLVTGILTAVKAAETHRRLAVAETVLREYVEKIETTAYTPCATTGSFPTSPPTSGYTVAVTAVSYWNQGSNPATYAASCSSDSGAQRVTITVTDPAKRATQSTDIVVRSSK